MNTQDCALSPAQLQAALEHEISHGCYRKVDKRLALRLAQAVIDDSCSSVFLAEKLADCLQIRLHRQAELRARSIDRLVQG